MAQLLRALAALPQNPGHGSPQPSETPVPWDLTTSPCLSGHQAHICEQTYIQEKHSNTENNKVIKHFKRF